MPNPTPEPSELLRASWSRAWLAMGLFGSEALLRQLVARYAEPHRAYHSTRHLVECITTLEPALHQAGQPGAVEIALWFHDAIYDVHGHDNEEQSARWAAQALLDAGAPPGTAARVQELVLATRHSALPQTADERLLVDVDLSILGAPAQRFDEYEHQVRQEYAWVPPQRFVEQRIRVLQQFLARPRIYCTEHFHARLEASARANLARSITRLGHRDPG